tara:strand:+ start:3830 stop:6418 length:2589 start_codon:yes stop_codon:yes gene_type:complete
MAFNMTAALKIVADVSGVKDVTKLEKALQGTEKAAAGAASAFKGMLSSKAFQAAAVGAAAIGTAMTISAKSAVDFEDKMAGVLKVMEDMNKNEVEGLKKEIMALGRVLPIGLKGIADIYAAAGQTGVPREKMREFAIDVGEVATAFDITAEKAAISMARMKTALGKSQPEVKLLFDAMNELGNQFAASSDEILEFMNRASGTGKAAGFTAEQTAALGTAMIGAGVETRVAATAFRNFATGLAEGSSMTAQQIDALVELGFIQHDAAGAEQRLTEEVERQSSERIAIARNETDQIAKELNRRYQDQMTALRDGMDDQNEAITDALRDRADQEIKALRRQMRDRLKIARESGKGDVDAIRDSFDERIDMVRDALKQDLKIQRRAARDRLTNVKRRVDDEKEVELKAIRERQKARIEAIKKEEAEGKEAAKAASQKIVEDASKAFSAKFHADAIGTITEVFERINQLPAPERLGMITKLFDEQAARGINQMIGNMDNYHKALELVANTTNFAGSTNKEFMKQVGTTASQMQIAKNAFSELSITFGTSFLPAINGVMKAIAPMIQGFSWLLNKVPGLGFLVAGLGAAFVGITVALPVIASVVTIVSTLGLTLSGVLPIIGTVVAVIAGIGVAFVAVKDVVIPAVQWIWNKLTEFGYWLGLQIVNWTQGFVQIGPTVVSALGQAFSQVVQIVTTPFKAAIDVVGQLFQSLISSFTSRINAFWTWAMGIFKAAQRLLSRRKASGSKSKSKGGKKKGAAAGGLLTGPTSVLAGEAGGEYLVPANKAAAFSRNYLGGVRGAAAVPGGQRFAEGGFTGNANINITTGPVSQVDGTNFITVTDMTKAVQQGVNQTLDLLAGDMQLRQQLGMS